MTNPEDINRVAIEVMGAMIMHERGIVSKTYERLNNAWEGSRHYSIISSNPKFLKELECLSNT